MKNSYKKIPYNYLTICFHPSPQMISRICATSFTQLLFHSSLFALVCLILRYNRLMVKKRLRSEIRMGKSPGCIYSSVENHHSQPLSPKNSIFSGKSLTKIKFLPASPFLNLGWGMLQFIGMSCLLIRLLNFCKFWLRARSALLDDGPVQRELVCPLPIPGGKSQIGRRGDE